MRFQGFNLRSSVPTLEPSSVVSGKACRGKKLLSYQWANMLSPLTFLHNLEYRSVRKRFGR